MTTPIPAVPVRGWYGLADCRLDDFRTVVEQATDPADYPLRGLGAGGPTSARLSSRTGAGARQPGRRAD